MIQSLLRFFCRLHMKISPRRMGGQVHPGAITPQPTQGNHQIRLV